MNAAPKLSIVIPVYNAEAFLHQTLDSILNQSLKEIEVLCVDDGSTDSSLSILRDYAAKDPRVQVFQQHNLHAGVARNRGIEAAKGEYIHFLDADDYVLDFAYEILVGRMDRHQLDCIKFASVPFDMQLGTTVENEDYTLNAMKPARMNRLLNLDRGSPLYLLNVAPWNGMYRRSFLMDHNIRFNDLFCVNDRSFFNRVLTNAERMMISRDFLVVHRVNMSASLVGKRAMHYDCQIRSVQIVEENLKADHVPMEIAEQVMEREFLDLCVWMVKLGDDPECGEKVQAMTWDFVDAYQGPFRRMLHSIYRKKSASMGTTAPAAPKALAFEQQACSKPKISVVLPIYNVEDYLTEALYSLSRQNLAEMEFLCVNDGSTDSSPLIVRSFAARDKRFRLLDGPNGGYGKAMNRGMDAARGEYMAILEPDDYVLENTYLKLYKTAQANDLDLLKTDFFTFTVRDNGILQSRRVNLTSEKSWYNRVLCPGSEPECFTFPINTWSGLYNLSFLRENDIRHNETPGASYQDNGFFFKTFCCARQAMFLNTPFYMYRRDNPNASMLSQSKLYCVTEEFRLIQAWLKERPQLWRKYSGLFYAKKFASFLVTYRRITDAQRLEYLRHIQDEFKPLVDSGELTQDAFLGEIGFFHWGTLKEIIASPEDYFDRIRVSVIIPVYNGEAHLRQCLDSILSRAELRIEVICVDDGSTDSSLDILREYEAGDPRVRVFTQPNGGAGAARNNGLQYARGEYLSFLDADDFFEYNMLSVAYQRAHGMDCDIVVFRSDLFNEADRSYRPSAHTIRNELLPLHQPFAGSELQENVFGVFAGWAWDKLFRTSFIRELGITFQEQRTTNDMLFVFSAILQAERICTSSSVLAHHRREAGSLSVTREKSWDCFYHALVALRQQLRDWGMYDEREQDFVNYSLHFALWQLTTLRGSAYFLLYDKLRQEWFQELTVTGREEIYFYNLVEYHQMEEIMSLSAGDFLFARLDETQLALESANNALRNLRAQNRDLRSQLSEARRKARKSKKSMNKMRSSAAWKLGRILTWLPRALKKLLKR